ncbi:MAG: peptidylprolyl isomerase [Bacteroidetes bacterium QS_8_68_28]|nr:MAG: peptidylprolyl isomerase [Bacteroidetes bacterium QS_8_68_28]
MRYRRLASAFAFASLLLLAACQERTTQESAAPDDTAVSGTASPALDTSLTPSDTTRGAPSAGSPSDTTSAGAGPATVSPGQYTTTASGLKYHDLREGSGASPSASDTVRVHYTGWLRSDSTQFDSSRDRGRPVTFQLNRVIEGWTEGVQSMQVGGRRQLVIPPDLAYGQRGRRSIPPGAALIFQVELLGVKGAQDGGPTQGGAP